MNRDPRSGRSSRLISSPAASIEIASQDGGELKSRSAYLCAAPRFFVGTGQVQRRIISWELARGVRGNLTREEF